MSLVPAALRSGTVAAIAYDAKGEKPLGFTATNMGGFSYAQAARCQTVPAGTVALEVGDSVTLRWVDGWGRLSPISKPINVVQGRRR